MLISEARGEWLRMAMGLEADIIIKAMVSEETIKKYGVKSNRKLRCSRYWALPSEFFKTQMNKVRTSWSDLTAGPALIGRLE